MKRVLVGMVSGLVVLLLGTSALADTHEGHQPLKHAPVLLTEVHSPLEVTGTWTSERKLWADPLKSSAGKGDVQADKLGFWWAGYYIETVTNTLIENSVRRDPAEAFKMLGRGVCMDTSETTSMTGTLSISGEAKFSDAIKASFGFSGSGTRTFTQTYKYCGPSETSPYRYRYFYKQLIYNKYGSSVVRIFYYWDGRLAGVESGTSDVLVPYMGTFTEDRNE